MEIDRIKSCKEFELSTKSRDEYYSIQLSEWKELIKVC